jgi:hypothetical protein
VVIVVVVFVEIIVGRNCFSCIGGPFKNTGDIAGEITDSISGEVSVAGTNKDTGKVASVGTGECLITSVSAGNCPIAGIITDDVAGTMRVAGSVTSIVTDTFTVAGIVVGACVIVFKTSGTFCGITVLVVVVVVSFTVGGMCGENSILGRRVFILVRGSIGGLRGKERLERSSSFNHSLKSSLNFC